MQKRTRKLGLEGSLASLLKISIAEDEIGNGIEFLLDEIKGKEKAKEVEQYKNDPAGFINDRCWIFNPEKDPAVFRFKLYDYQKDFIRDDIYPAYKNQEDILDEKSRQMGFSWLYMAFFLWGLLFNEGFSGFAMSYKERLVDDGGSESSIDSLFGKLRFLYDNLHREESDEFEFDTLHFKFLRIVNRRTGAYLIGESCNVNAGRGGTYSFGLWDEVASTPKSERIHPSFHQAVRCRCYNSTVRGKGNVFARLRHDANVNIKKLTFHWSLHPDKSVGLIKDEDGKYSSPWYRNECLSLTPTQVAQELDIDYEASVEGRIYTKFQRAVHVRPLDFNPEWKSSSIISWDLGVADETVGTVMQMDNQGNIGIVDEIVGTDEEIRFYIALICGVQPPEFKFLPAEKRKVVTPFLFRARQYGYGDLINVAGPDSLQRSITSKASVVQQFRTAGRLGRDERTGRITDRRYKNLQIIPLTGYRVMDRVVETKKIMDPNRNHLIVSERCVNTIECLLNYQWSQTAEGTNRESPEHNWASHSADSVGMGVLWYMKHRKPGRKPPVGDRISRRKPQGLMGTMRVGRR